MRLVLDTDAVVAGMRSPSGASAAILLAARDRRIALPATVPLCLEYEAVCSRPEHVEAARLQPADLTVFLDAVIELIEPVQVWFLWRPQLSDAADELVLEAAVNGQADAIVTFNRRHFLRAADRFGLEILLPSDAIRRLR